MELHSTGTVPLKGFAPFPLNPRDVVIRIAKSLNKAVINNILGVFPTQIYLFWNIDDLKVLQVGS